MKLLLGNSLAPTLCDYFDTQVQDNVDISPLPASLWKFSAGQAFSEHFGDVEGEAVVVIQSLGSVDTHSTNDFAMQLLFQIAELKRSVKEGGGGAKAVWVIAPYSGYGRQDRLVDGRGVSMGIDTFGSLLKHVGADGFSTINMHSASGIELLERHFDEGQVFNLSVTDLIAQYVEETIGAEDLAVGGPDDGAHEEAAALAARLGADQFAFKKRHTGVNDTEVIGFEGDVRGKKTLTFDDEIDTAGTITNSQDRLAEEGATERYISSPNGVFSKGGLETVFTAGSRGNRLVRQLVITDSIDPTFEIERLRRQYSDLDDMERVKVLSVGPMLWNHVVDDIANRPLMKAEVG